MNWETLMCFGDSITIGARSYCGYPEYAGNYLEKELGNKWNIINHAIYIQPAAYQSFCFPDHFYKR